MDPADFIEDQASVIVVDNDEILNPDSESEECNSNSNSSRFGFFTRDGMIRIEEGNDEHGVIMKSFLSGMGDLGKDTSVVAIHKNCYSSLTGQARVESFRVFSEAVAKKCGGSANIKHGWYGGSREEICGIVSHGFSRCGLPVNSESYGAGIYLSPANFSIDSALATAPDENGLRHVLLCRVILGNMEMVCPGSKQFHPSTKDFDSGVDSLSEPRKYIVWSAYMNSHIFPNYIISFRSPPFKGVQRMQASAAKPTSPWMRFPTLVSMLSRFLPPPKMELITRYHNSYRENKLSRPQLILKLRQIAGDSLLATVIKYYRNMQLDNRAGLRAAVRSVVRRHASNT